jgi:hypothetical protein
VAEPTTLTLLKAMQVCLQSVQVANGYHTDAGRFVTLEPRQIPESQSALIALAMDSRDRATDNAVSRTHRQVTVMVVAKVAADRSNAQESLHALIDDIEQAFELRHAEFPKGYQYPVFMDAKPVTPAEGMEWVGAQVRFTAVVPKRQS